MESFDGVKIAPGAYDEPTQDCPYCDGVMDADWVDVGVGSVQCGPYHCMSCGASEIGPEIEDWYYKDREGNTLNIEFDDNGWVWGLLRYDHPFSDKELETGIYDPLKEKLSPYANTFKGQLVNHKVAKSLYRKGLLDEKK